MGYKPVQVKAAVFRPPVISPWLNLLLFLLVIPTIFVFVANL
ncbi:MULTISPECIES: hypothetical protein [Thermoactinomyces]|nr:MULTISPECIES: hypothetical protein [Thermoactinomyces]